MFVPAGSSRRTDRRGWLIAFFLAVTAHAAAYQQFAQDTAVSRPIESLPLVTVTLVAAAAVQPAPEPEPQPVASAPPPEPVVAAPVAKPPPRPARQNPSVKPVKTPPRKVAPQQTPSRVAQATAGTSPPAAGPPAVPELPLELPRVDAAYLRNPPPAYPKRLLRRGVEGEVLVHAQVLDDGRCNHVQVKESSGFRQFDEAALAAVKDWRFVPARRGTETVMAWVDVPIAFRITRSR